MRALKQDIALKYMGLLTKLLIQLAAKPIVRELLLSHPTFFRKLRKLPDS